MLEQYLSQLSQASVFYSLSGLAVAGGFALLGYIGLPAHLDRWRKAYWVSVIFLASILMTNVIGGLAAFQSSLAGMVNDFDAVAKVSPVVEGFEEHFHDAHEPLRSWAGTAMATERDEFADGYVDIRVDQAPEQIANAYSSAKAAQDATGVRQYIIASNVGSTNLYFSKTQGASLYKKANVDRLKEGIPIVRFYVFANEQKGYIFLSDNKVAPDFPHFVDDVIELAKTTKAVYSVAINISGSDISPGDARDLLLIGKSFLAETHLNDDWFPEYARATEENKKTSGHPNIDHARDDLAKLAALVGDGNTCVMVHAYSAPHQTPLTCTIIEMPDEEIGDNFAHWQNKQIQTRGHRTIAQCIYSGVLRDAGIMTGPEPCEQ
jgi:hypothetical protein